MKVYYLRTASSFEILFWLIKTGIDQYEKAIIPPHLGTYFGITCNITSYNLSKLIT